MLIIYVDIHVESMKAFYPFGTFFTHRSLRLERGPKGGAGHPARLISDISKMPLDVGAAFGGYEDLQPLGATRFNLATPRALK